VAWSSISPAQAPRHRPLAKEGKGCPGQPPVPWDKLLCRLLAFIKNAEVASRMGAGRYLTHYCTRPIPRRYLTRPAPSLETCSFPERAVVPWPGVCQDRLLTHGTNSFSFHPPSLKSAKTDSFSPRLARPKGLMIMPLLFWSVSSITPNPPGLESSTPRKGRQGVPGTDSFSRVHPLLHPPDPRLPIQPLVPWVRVLFISPPLHPPNPWRAKTRRLSRGLEFAKTDYFTPVKPARPGRAGTRSFSPGLLESEHEYVSSVCTPPKGRLLDLK
jgi:hypothetical protein